MKKAYTVKEIDALRNACDERYMSRYVPGAVYTGYSDSKRILAVEEMVRTYMLAGITAEDIIEADRPKDAARALGTEGTG